MDEPLMPLDILAKNASKEALEKWRSAVKRSRLVVNFVKRREALKKIRNTEDNLRFAFNAYKVAFRFLNAVGQSESKQAQAAREASSEDEPLEEVGRAALEDELSDEARETGFNIHPDKLASMDNLRFAFNAYKVAFRFLNAVGQSESKQAQAAREASSEDELSDEARETGFSIYPDKLASMVRNRDIESLTFFGGVEGLASSVKVSLNEGVKKSDVAIRQKFYGFNRYSEKPSRSFWMFVWDALQDLNHTIFMVCAVVSIVVGLATKGWTKGMYDGLGIVLSIFLVILVTAVGDYKQSLQFQDLGKEKKRIFIEVTRDECIKKVSIYDLVVGDVVRLSMGDQVPADGILISGQNLLVDESSLSGKSVPLNKHKKKPFLLAGTKVQDGLGKMLVTTVGMRTEWGKMMMTLSEGGEDDTLLQGKLNGIATNIGKIGWVFAVQTFMELTVRFLVEKALHKKFRDWSSRDALTILNYFTGTVAPEGLPLAVTLTIAFAIKKLMNEKARVRLLCASEKMGSECSRPEVCIKTPEYLKEMIPIMYEEQVRNTDATRQEQIDIASSEEEVDGVTSDGTNDVPAVHEADIGLAGDIGGTEDAKENADVIKVDANSTTLVEVGKWGPAVYANIQKFVQFRLTVNVVALMINFLSTCISGSGPLTVVQLLWVNLIMNTLGALALATPPLNEELMNRSPVRRNVSFITKAMWRNIIGQIIYQLAVLLVLNYDGKQLLRLKGSNAAAILKTFIFNTFVFCQVFNEINSRGIEKINILRGMFSSWIFIGVVVSSVVLQVIIVEFVGTVVGSVPLRWQLWLISILIGAVSMPVALVLKCIAKRHNHYRPQPCSGPELV